MAGEFLPPVVTILDGDLSPLLDKIAQAKAAIKSLGNTSVVVDVRFNVDQASLARVKAMQDAITSSSAIGSNRQVAQTNNGIAASLLAIDAANKTLSGGSSGRRMPGWFGWIADSRNIDALHGAAVGLVAIGAALTGAAIGAGALTAAWSKGAVEIVAQGASLYTAVAAQNGSLGAAFGLKPNPAWVASQQAGVGQSYAFLGGITNYLNTHQNALLANEGTSIGGWLDTAVAKMDLSSNKGGVFGSFMKTVNTDAIGLGRTASNIGDVIGKTIAHSPGEIEWLTSGLSGITGLLAKGVNTSVGGDLLSGLMMLHSLTFLSGLAGKAGGALGLIGKINPAADLTAEELAKGETGYSLHGMFSTLGGNAAGLLGGIIGTGAIGRGGGLAGLLMKGAVATDGKAGLGGLSSLLEGGAYGLAGAGEGVAGIGLAGAGLIGATLLAAGLFGYKVANSPSQDQLLVSSSLNRIGNQTTPAGATKNIAAAMQVIGTTLGSNSAIFNAGGGTTDYRKLALEAKENGTTGLDLIGNNDALYSGMLKVGTSVHNETSGINAAAKAFGGLGNAVALSALAGIKWQNVQAGNKKATEDQIQVIKNAITEYTAMSGQLAGREAIVNQKAVATVSGKAWTNMSNVNSAMDTYVGAMTGGAGALGGILNSLSGTAPMLSGSKFLTTQGAQVSSFVNTNQAISGSLEPLIDSFRQAQAVGAISMPQLQKGILSAAASLGPLAKGSTAAQQELVGMARQSGLNVTSFSQLMQMAGGANNALTNTTKVTEQVAQNFAKLGPLGQQVANIMQNDQATAFAKVAEMGGKVQSSTVQLMGAMTQFPGHSAQVEAAADRQYKALQNAGLSAQQAQKMLQQEGLAWTRLPTGTKKQTVTFTLVGQVTGNTTAINYLNAAGGVTGHATFTKQASSGIGGFAGHALGGTANAGQWSWVGEKGPELMYMPPGSSVTPNFRTGQAMSSASVGAGGGDIHNHIYIDGKELFSAIKRQTYQYNANNGNRDAQGRVAGNMRPR